MCFSCVPFLTNRLVCIRAVFEVQLCPDQSDFTLERAARSLADAYVCGCDVREEKPDRFVFSFSFVPCLCRFAHNVECTGWYLR